MLLATLGLNPGKAYQMGALGEVELFGKAKNQTQQNAQPCSLQSQLPMAKQMEGGQLPRPGVTWPLLAPRKL
jgi:hypothetical protein